MLKNPVYLLLTIMLIGLPGSPEAQDKTLVFSTHVQQGSDLYQVTFEIMQEAFRRVGYRYEMESYPGKRALYLSNSGDTDGEAHRIYGIDTNYPNLVRIPEVQQIIYNHAYAVQPIVLAKGWESMGPYRVAVQRGSIFVTQKAKAFAQSVAELGSYESIFKYVAAGRADIAIGTPHFVSEVLQKPDYAKMGFQRIDPPLSALPIYAYLHQDHAELAPLVARAMHEMKMDGSYQKIMQRLE